MDEAEYEAYLKTCASEMLFSELQYTIHFYRNAISSQERLFNEGYKEESFMQMRLAESLNKQILLISGILFNRLLTQVEKEVGKDGENFKG